MSPRLLKPRQNIPLAEFTTWRVGGPARWILEPESVDETLEALQWARANGHPCQVIGAGSNLLIHDNGLPGLTLGKSSFQLGVEPSPGRGGGGNFGLEVEVDDSARASERKSHAAKLPPPAESPRI